VNRERVYGLVVLRADGLRVKSRVHDSLPDTYRLRLRYTRADSEALYDVPFWRHCREDTDVSNVQGLLDFYAENGPTGFCRYRLPRMENDFGVEGYLVMLVGNRVPYGAKHRASDEERQRWERHRAAFSATASSGLDVKEALSYVRHPGWQWNADVAAQNAPSVAHQGR